MSDEKIDQEMLKALGNLKVEGVNVSNEEYQEVSRILRKHRDKLDEKAVGSLLYSLYTNRKLIEEENEKHK